MSMTLIDWIVSVDDDYLAQWANKGLLRRGKKQFQKCIESGALPDSWVLTSRDARADIDGYQQCLNAIGVDHLQCSCAAVGPCFHLIAFIYGLQQLAGAVTENNQAETPKSSPDNMETTEDDLANQGTISNPERMPWHVMDLDSLATLFTKAQMKKAIQYYHQGVAVKWQETPKSLSATIDLKQTYQVRISSAQNLATSLCSCQQSNCEHRALALLVFAVDSGSIIVPYDVEVLNDWQYQLLEQVQLWLNGLAQQGMIGMNKLQLDKGSRLSLELKQADFPRPAFLLAQVVQQLLPQQSSRQSPLQNEQGSQLLQSHLAQLYAHLQALKSQPLRQPLNQLAGLHRRQFSLVRSLDLFGIGVEQWQNSEGLSRFKYWFYNPNAQAFYSVNYLSEQGESLNTALLGNRYMSSLMNAQCQLTHGWASRDGGISQREGTLISHVSPLASDEEKLSLTAMLASFKTLPAQMAEITHHIRTNPYDRAIAHQGVVRCHHLKPLEVDRLNQCWRTTCYDELGAAFTVRIDAAAESYIVDNWQAHYQDAEAVFGRWQWQGNTLYFLPITLMSQTCFYYLQVKGGQLKHREGERQ